MAITSLDPQKTIAGGVTSATTPTTTMTAPWKTYNQYFANNPEALNWGHYQTSDIAGTPEAEHFNQIWGRQTQNNPQNIPNPWQFGQEYNRYKSTLPSEYQNLINYGISPESVASGAITGIAGSSGVTPIPKPGGGTYGTGSGSSYSMNPEVLKKMWR
jgi:hypothetical protein